MSEHARIHEPPECVHIPTYARDEYLVFRNVRVVPLTVLGFTAEVGQPGLTAATYVDLQEDPGSREALARYFDELARYWRGWSGTRSVVIHSLHLSCTHERIANATLRIALFRDPWSENTGWCVDRCEVSIELGNLERIAEDVRAFLRVDRDLSRFGDPVRNRRKEP